MASRFEIDDELIAEQNRKAQAWLDEDYDHLACKLRRRQLDIEGLTHRAQAFRVAVPAWGVGTGGTSFARSPGVGEPREVSENLEGCSTIFKLSSSTPAVSLH